MVPDPPARAVALVSGGLDSVTLAHQLAAAGTDLELLAVDYGQRHRRELACAAACAERFAAPYHEIDLRAVGRLLTGSALTDASVAVPEGHYEAPTMAATVVPNRNAILLSVAVGVALAAGIDTVATAVHAGDHAVYPDCRPEFVAAFEHMARVANEGVGPGPVRVLAPFVHAKKHEIVALGARLGVPFAATWSCYAGGERHCGRCGTCVERREAFERAGVADPTEYEVR